MAGIQQYNERVLPTAKAGKSFSLPGEKSRPYNMPYVEDTRASSLSKALTDIGNDMFEKEATEQSNEWYVAGLKKKMEINAFAKENAMKLSSEELEKQTKEQWEDFWSEMNESVTNTKAKKHLQTQLGVEGIRLEGSVKGLAIQAGDKRLEAKTNAQLFELKELYYATDDAKEKGDTLVAINSLFDTMEATGKYPDIEITRKQFLSSLHFNDIKSKSIKNPNAAYHHYIENGGLDKIEGLTFEQKNKLETEIISNAFTDLRRQDYLEAREEKAQKEMWQNNEMEAAIGLATGKLEIGQIYELGRQKQVSPQFVESMAMQQLGKGVEDNPFAIEQLRELNRQGRHSEAEQLGLVFLKEGLISVKTYSSEQDAGKDKSYKKDEQFITDTLTVVDKLNPDPQLEAQNKFKANEALNMYRRQRSRGVSSEDALTTTLRTYNRFWDTTQDEYNGVLEEAKSLANKAKTNPSSITEEDRAKMLQLDNTLMQMGQALKSREKYNDIFGSN